ncbi:family 1 encapsulin nanocompartment shell protein [Sulfuricurvum sp.]|uniref:family 1 encapsulin nanocompartment shell protein n=1 Tax=Sulfuricurvum sp. TaxID=2025608 RepID=UPI002D6F407B|nr:family 1 encapsulin nanocompartment shell protein [Sulfuricurvum sp.]HZF71031.1 family 1 encapsulin nanocompartment shell protein [Sulfuricurvum sp.]
MKFLNRETSPIAPAVWTQIDAVFTPLLSQRLKLRSLVGFTPVPFETDAIPTGNLKTLSTSENLTLSAREPLRMVEMRYDFELPKSIVEAFKRDKPDFDDSIFKKVSNHFSAVENSLILDGLKEVEIEGILKKIPRKPIHAKNTKGLIDAVAAMIAAFGAEFVEGPYKLVLSTATLIKMVAESEGGISVKTRLESLIGANFFVVCESIGDDKILALSQRGGDFVLYNGLDVSIGYTEEKEDSYSLFLTESCSFRIINPEAAVLITL